MQTKRLAIAIAAVVSFDSVGAMQSVSRQWLIENVGGSWEVRETGQKDRRMGAKYDVITAGSQIRCVALPCTLEYSTDGGRAKPLFPKPPPLSRWTLVPQPQDPPVGRTAAELQQIIGTIGVRGGGDKAGPTCGGELPLLAPTCNDTIDTTAFKVEWTPRPSEAGKLFTLLIGSADSSEKRRWNSILADSGEFELDAIGDYLADLSLPDRPTDVTIRLMRTENLDAVRLVRLPSRADAAEHRRKLQALSRLPALPRQLATLEEFLKMGMWSRAASVSLTLLRDAPDSLELRKYALVGLCGSDFANEIARLRTSLGDAGVTGICEQERAPR